jgi:hypothetical protein
MINRTGGGPISGVWKPKTLILSAGMLSVIIVLLSGEKVCDRNFEGKIQAQGTTTGLIASSEPRRLGPAWYIRSGQWRADLRSLVAVLQYLREPAGLAQTNGAVAKADKV